MSDPLRPLAPGDPLPTSARTWNALLGSARSRQAASSPLPSGGPIKFSKVEPESEVGLEHRFLYFNFAGHVAAFPLSEIADALEESPYTLSIPYAGLRWFHTEAIPSTVEAAFFDVEIFRLTGVLSDQVRFSLFHRRVTSSGGTWDRILRVGVISLDWNEITGDAPFIDNRAVRYIETFGDWVTIGKLVLSNRPIWLLPNEVYPLETQVSEIYSINAKTLAYGEKADGWETVLRNETQKPWCVIPAETSHYGFGENGLGLDLASSWGTTPKLLRLMHRGRYSVRVHGSYTLSDECFDFAPIEHDGDTVATVVSCNPFTAYPAGAYIAISANVWVVQDPTYKIRSFFTVVESLPVGFSVTIPGDVSTLDTRFRRFFFDKTFEFTVGDPDFPFCPSDVGVFAENHSLGDVTFSLQCEVTGFLQLGGRIANEKSFLLGGESGPTPVLSATPTELNPIADVGEDAAPDTFEIQNVGSGTLTYSIANGAAWLSCDPLTGDSNGDVDTITVTYDTAALSIGTYEAEITISGNATNTPLTIPVTLTIAATGTAPSISLSPTTLSPVVAEGNNATSQTFDITNDGTGPVDLLFSITDDAAWISLAPSSGELGAGASVTIYINYSTDALPGDNYTGTITVSGNASNSPQTVTVNLEVIPGPPGPP